MRPPSSKFETYLTSERAFAFLVLTGVIQFSVYLLMAFIQPDAVTISGDFVAFWAAGREVLQGNLAVLYQPDGLASAIVQHQPDAAEISASLTWQYPPHSSLIFSPIGALPFAPAYLLWCAFGLAAFTAALKQLSINGKALIALLLSPFVFLAIITGQNGLFTSALLIFAVTQIKSRPILAGLAAAALTIKPQLGLLLPIAYLAARAWRPLFVATGASLIFWTGSALIAGKASWLAFFDSVLSVSGSVDSGLMPLFKMVTLFSALRLANVPSALAIVACLVFAAIAAIAVAWVWRRTGDAELRLAALSATTLLIAPYGFYYELTIALPAVFIVARRGHENGWLPFERGLLALVILGSLMLPGPEIRAGLSFGFAFMLTIALITARRLAFELGAFKPSENHTSIHAASKAGTL